MKTKKRKTLDDVPTAVVVNIAAVPRSKVGKPSHFAVCKRDRKGHCLPAKGGSALEGLEGGTVPTGKVKALVTPPGAKTPAEKTVKKKGVAGEKVTPPPPGDHLKADVHADRNRDGVTDQARVGVPAFDVPPPPKVPRLPNLTVRERQAEKSFAEAFERDPDGMARRALDEFKKSAKPGEPPTFGTDDAKVLAPEWMHPDQNVRSQNRATLNLALHQTANAVTKRAFVRHLDTLSPGDEITVTVGGCGAGKGYGLKNVPAVLDVKNNSKAVWDSAGDQNATENPWIQAEAEKRGLRVNYVYVHADPYKSWADPERGAIKRAGDPKDGRMVDAKVFADSYALGARNHKRFADDNAGNPNARFFYIDNTGKPKDIPGIPAKDLSYDARGLAKFAEDTVLKGEVPSPPHVVRGALSGRRVWAGEG